MVCVRIFTHIQFTWYVPIGTTTTFAAGCLASLVLPEKPREENEPTAA
jgi:hypothetical protein